MDDVHVMPIIKSGTFQLLIIGRKAQRFDQMQMLGSRQGMGGPGGGNDGGDSGYSAPRPNPPASRAGAPSGGGARPAPAKSTSGFDDMDDDIPF